MNTALTKSKFDKPLREVRNPGNVNSKPTVSSTGTLLCKDGSSKTVQLLRDTGASQSLISHNVLVDVDTRDLGEVVLLQGNADIIKTLAFTKGQFRTTDKEDVRVFTEDGWHRPNPHTCISTMEQASSPTPPPATPAEDKSPLLKKLVATQRYKRGGSTTTDSNSSSDDSSSTTIYSSFGGGDSGGSSSNRSSSSTANDGGSGTNSSSGGGGSGSSTTNYSGCSSSSSSNSSSSSTINACSGVSGNHSSSSGGGSASSTTNYSGSSGGSSSSSTIDGGSGVSGTNSSSSGGSGSSSGDSSTNSCCSLYNTSDEGQKETRPKGNHPTHPTPPREGGGGQDLPPLTTDGETFEEMMGHLDEVKQGELRMLLHQYSNLLGEVPTQTSFFSHDIQLTDTTPIRMLL
ncbi:uncharacterized protein [Procambarus clarkii]|uniref:uncharacterized protein n=1 Tax=Procambarus clarkii TaxID=6728 RepID=UPI0037441148